jgi:hypothetical protein
LYRNAMLGAKSIIIITRSLIMSLRFYGTSATVSTQKCGERDRKRGEREGREREREQRKIASAGASA